ncbi:juvenile hormone acid O-methyltransferase-like [Nylanderia fulva]|uniref:juvenile hormone acid O-methyltransferase-like n=1 Tax=Nylanderia fulva TaxID=613905 RepID=UPI0010FB6DDF|nr:juvenile hormone acid O-methyltransferase-like [Nylanderia fulva]
MELAEDYLASSNMQNRDTSELIDEFSAEMSKMKGKCLDIGCGPGYITKEILSRVLPNESEIVGADISHKMINYARTFYSGERLSYIVLDIESDLPSDQIEQYDNIISFYTMHWTYDICKAFQNIYKLLRPEGKALIMFLAHHFGFEAYTRLQEHPQFQPYLYDAHRYVPYFQRKCAKNMKASLQKILENIGFKILHCSKREKSFQYSNRESLKNQASAVNPFLKRFPDDKSKDDFLEQLINEILNLNVHTPLKDKNNKDDNIILKYHLLVAYVSKPSTSKP